MTFRELCTKEVVQLKDGACLGRVDDLEPVSYTHLVQQRLIDAGVGFVDLHLTGGYAAVEETLEVPLHQQGKHILGNVAQVIDAVAMLLELLDKGLRCV